MNFSEPKTVRWPFYAGLFLTTLTTLLYQMLLTRIFSVTMWYHFAFVAVSLAMFGLTAGAILVYLFPGFFTLGRTQAHVALSAFFYAFFMVPCLLTQLALPFRVQGLVGIYSLGFTYLVSSVPFIFGGVAVCLVLTRFEQKINKLYAVDLLGAGIGCALLIPLLQVLDGPTAVVAVSALAAVGSWLFASDSGRKGLGRLSLAWALLCALFVVWHSPRFRNQKPFLSIMWVKGRSDPPRVYERWNAFSCVRVHEHPMDCLTLEYLRKTEGTIAPPRDYNMNIDAAGATPITEFDRDLKKLSFLKSHVINAVHLLRPDSKLLVIGTGGGIDVLSGLYFKQKQIVGVEINKVILDTLNGRFGNFSGHLDRYPNVSFHHDEGRSFITRSNDTYDIILANVIDTWAAGASGAFALTENSLYTVEAWTEYLKHLTPRGIITFNRWYFHAYPDEMYRLAGLGVAALKRIGVQDTRGHIVLLTPKRVEADEAWTTGNLMVSKEPFTKQDLDLIDNLPKTMPVEVKLTPRFAIDDIFARVADGKNLGEFYRNFPLEISPSTDDRPFFFHRFRILDTLKLLAGKKLPPSADINMKGIVVLMALLVTMILLTLATVFFPLLLKDRAVNFPENLRFLLYFGSIGIAFMMVEISQLERLSLFLGHPTYSLSVVLFSLLLGSGLGSFASGYFFAVQDPARKILPFDALLIAVVLFGLATPALIAKFTPEQIGTRIVVSILILLPLGFMMGMPFPIGMKQALQKPGSPTAWFWGINGVASVYSTVFAVTVSISLGISATYWIGGFFYLLAALAIFSEFSRSARLKTSV